jgi:hypothetical protein
VVLAARGARETEKGIRKIGDKNLIAMLRKQARKVTLEALVIAIMLTGVWFIF